MQWSNPVWVTVQKLSTQLYTRCKGNVGNLNLQRNRAEQVSPEYNPDETMGTRLVVNWSWKRTEGSFIQRTSFFPGREMLRKEREKK